MARDLTDKQKRFVEEYLIDLNATQACIRAGYSVRNADKIGSQLLGKTRVSEAIQAELANRSRRTGITQDRVIQELARIAFVNINDIVNDDGSLRQTASPDDLKCVESYSVSISDTDKGYSSQYSVKLSPKLKALELLGKHLGMFNDKVQVDLCVPVFGGEENLED